MSPFRALFERALVESDGECSAVITAEAGARTLGSGWLAIRRSHVPHANPRAPFVCCQSAWAVMGSRGESGHAQLEPNQRAAQIIVLLFAAQLLSQLTLQATDNTFCTFARSRTSNVANRSRRSHQRNTSPFAFAQKNMK